MTCFSFEWIIFFNLSDCLLVHNIIFVVNEGVRYSKESGLTSIP